MTQDTTPAGGPVTLPPLLVALWRLLAAHRPAVRQARCFDRLRALVVGQVCSPSTPWASRSALATTCFA
jgi:hypothetical protein